MGRSAVPDPRRAKPILAAPVGATRSSCGSTPMRGLLGRQPQGPAVTRELSTTVPRPADRNQDTRAAESFTRHGRRR